MSHSKRWMTAGVAAVLLGSGTARATTEPRTVAIDVDESGYQPGLVACDDGEQVRLVQPIGEVGRAAPSDEQELAAGNTRGRG